MVEIQCPSDCAYLAAAREHPAAATVRRHQRDVGLMMHLMRDLNQRQSQLFVMVTTMLVRYEPPEFQPLIDNDVGEAAASLAATFETASRGVIYEHRPASLAAERLANALKPLLLEAGKGAGSSFERDAAVVLRRFEDAVREVRATETDNRRAFLDLAGRMMAQASPSDERDDASASDRPAAPRLIIP
jgi:hypothetical protein